MEYKQNSLEFTDLAKETESMFAKNINQIVMSGMAKYPEMGEWVVGKMNSALTTSERALIAETALVTFNVVESIQSRETKTFGANDVQDLTIWIAVAEDDKYEIDESKKDLNKIYEIIKEDIGNDQPKLAEYITARMRESVSLQEANLVGETAVIVYNSLIDYPNKKDPS